MRIFHSLTIAVALALPASAIAATQSAGGIHESIQTVVVIYSENRSFDNLYGTFPGARGLSAASAIAVIQLDRDGKPMRGLPAVWGGTASHVMQGAPTAPVGLTQGQTAIFLGGFNHPYDVAAV